MIRLQLDPVRRQARVRVAIEVQPERLKAIGGTPATRRRSVARRLVDHGMRAELVTTSYVTGSLAVSLDFPPNPPPAEIDQEGIAIVLPTLGGGFAAITSRCPRSRRRSARSPSRKSAPTPARCWQR